MLNVTLDTRSNLLQYMSSEYHPAIIQLYWYNKTMLKTSVMITELFTILDVEE
jgi:hypothetical protein